MRTANQRFKVSKCVGLPPALDEFRFRRALARMMAGSTDRRWLTHEAGLKRHEVDKLLRELHRQDALESVRASPVDATDGSNSSDAFARTLKRVRAWLADEPLGALSGDLSDTVGY
jgi:hypothetical protein